MLLDVPTRKLQIVLTTGTTTNKMPVLVSWFDKSSQSEVSGLTSSLTNGTTAVDIAPAPASLTRREIKTVSVYNKDTVAKTVKVLYNDNGTTFEIVKTTLQVDDTLGYSSDDGWYVQDLNGARKTGTGVVSATMGTFRNVAVNGDMSVSQVNGTTPVTTGVATDVYVIDQHIIRAAGAAVTAGQSIDATGCPTGFGTNLKINGAASNTNVTHKHRIEAKDARCFAGKRIAISVWLYQDSGAAMASATMKAFCPTTAADVFSALTQEGATQTFSIANAGTITKYTQFITMGSSNVARGLEIDIDLNAALLAGKTCYIAGLQIEAVTSDATVGTDFEFIPYGEQLRRCQRYLPYFAFATGAYCLLGTVYSATVGYTSLKFPVTTRVPPTGIVASVSSLFSFYAAGVGYTSSNTQFQAGSTTETGTINSTLTAAPAGNAAIIIIPAAGSLYFTGCQL